MRVSEFIKSLFTTKKFFILLLLIVLIGISIPVFGLPAKYVIYGILGVFLLALLIMLFSPAEKVENDKVTESGENRSPESEKEQKADSQGDLDIADLSYMKDLSLVLYRINFSDEDLKKDVLKYKFFLDRYLGQLSDDDVIDAEIADSLKSLVALCNVYIESENKVSESKQFGEEIPEFVVQTLEETGEKIKVQLQKNIEIISALSAPRN